MQVLLLAQVQVWQPTKTDWKVWQRVVSWNQKAVSKPPSAAPSMQLNAAWSASRAATSRGEADRMELFVEYQMRPLRVSCMRSRFRRLAGFACVVEAVGDYAKQAAEADHRPVRPGKGAQLRSGILEHVDV